MITALLAGAGVGLASSLHCAAMCGPIAVASCGRDRGRTTSYALGRLVGYTIVGAIVGAVAAPLTGSYQAPIRIAAAAIAAFVIARAGIRLLRRAPDPSLVPLRRKPRISPVLLGLATALFPCGALLSGLVIASGTGSALGGAVAMSAFAIASTPGLLVPVLGVASITRRFASARRVAGVALLALAGLTVVQAAMFARPKPHACCARKT